MAKSKRTPFKALNIQERTIIEIRYCRDFRKVCDIAVELGRAYTTIKREIGERPRSGTSKYQAHIAHAKALKRIAERGNVRKLERNTPLLEYVITKLKEDWTPEQITLRLPIEYKEDTHMRISHEAIYQYIYAKVDRGSGKMKDGALDLRIHLARGYARRRKRGFRQAQKLERAVSLPSIETRPLVVQERTTVGHWEGDTMVSRSSKERIKSLNERMSGVVLFEKTSDGTAVSCNHALIERLRAIPSPYVQTLTQDRGTENYDYHEVETALKLTCYFAHPYCSHERGSNENSNGLFRRYFPKGTDFGKIKNHEIAEVEYLINTRPRKRFGGLTPCEVFYQKTGFNIYPERPECVALFV
jgi:transposase, IS30 family